MIALGYPTQSAPPIIFFWYSHTWQYSATHPRQVSQLDLNIPLTAASTYLVNFWDEPHAKVIVKVVLPGHPFGKLLYYINPPTSLPAATSYSWFAVPSAVLPGAALLSRPLQQAGQKTIKIKWLYGNSWRHNITNNKFIKTAQKPKGRLKWKWKHSKMRKEEFRINRCEA